MYFFACGCACRWVFGCGCGYVAGYGSMQETCGVLTKRVRWPMMHREINIWSCFFFPLEFILTSLDILKYLKRVSLKHVKHLKSWVVWVRKKLKKT